MGRSLRSLAFLLPLYAAFFASGAASLVAEVTWNHMLIVVVGNSLSAAAMIIAIFMGGLGLGSAVGGRVFAGRRPSLLPYVLLEAAIGVWVLLSPALFDGLARAFTALADTMEARSGLTAMRLTVSAAALLVPATLMGATFPAIVSGAALESRARRTARVGYLYAVNTIGAAIGCFAAGYHLLLELGVRTTIGVASGLYLVAILGALAARAAGAPATAGPPATDASAPTSASGPPGDRRRRLAIATFAVGFVALAYEVLLTRLAILYLGNSISVFPLVLTAFLIGTGLSAMLGTRAFGALRDRERGGDLLFGGVAVASGALVLATPYLLLTDWVLGAERFARFVDTAARSPWPILGIIVAPTILVGAMLPLAIRMLRPRGRDETTRTAATLYALNTAGGLLGAGLVNHALVPAVGIQGAIALLVAMCAAVGTAAFVPARTGAGRRAGAALGVAVLVGGGVLALPGMMSLYARKIADSTRAEETEVLLVREGRAATVTVLDQRDPRHGSYRDMYLNGVEEASTRPWHVQLFKLLGMLPTALHESEEPKEALVIAFGAGITAGSVLASDRVASLDVVDLNPDIEGINDLFTEVNGDVFHRERFRFHNEDGRNYLVTSGRKYDLVIGDSTHPRAYDSWILYTEEFYRAVRERLKPGGIFAQWVPVLGSMQGAIIRIHLNTFRSVFPNSTFWYVYGSDQAFLLATPEPLVIDVDRLQAELDRLPAWFGAEEYQLDTVTRVAGFFWMDAPAMDRMIAGETRVNRDDFHYFDKQSAVWTLPPPAQLPFFQASAIPFLRGLDDAGRVAVTREQTVAQQLARFVFLRDVPALQDAWCFAPENVNTRWWMSLETGGDLPDADAFCAERTLRRYRDAVAAHPDSPRALNALADALTTAGQLDEALTLAERAVELAPEDGMILDTWGWALHRNGDHAAARDALRRAAERLPGHPIVLYHLGAANVALGDEARARDLLERALAHPGGFPGRESAQDLLVGLD